MPAGFEAEINVSQTTLKEKYGASTYVIQRWKREAGKIRKEPTMCDFRPNITCGSGEKSKCSKCGWNPEEHMKILRILRRDGMEAVRRYVAARDAPAVKSGENN